MDVTIAIIGALATVTTVILSNHYSIRIQKRFEERKLKEQYYLKFIEALSDNVMLENKEEAMNSLAYARQRLLLIGSCEVVNNLIDFENTVRNCSIEPNNKKLSLQHDIMFTNLMKALRNDLYNNKSSMKNKFINENYPLVGIQGGRPKHNENE